MPRIHTALAKAKAGGLYKATIVTEPYDGGYRSSVINVMRLTTKRAAGIDVAHDPFPVLTAETEDLAERRADLHFKACAKLGTLGL